MSRPPREFTPGSTYHIMNKTVPELSFSNTDLLLLKKTLENGAKKFNIKIGYFNIMKNHFHLHVYFPLDAEHISIVMHWIGTQMAKAINKVLDRKGHVFFQRFTAKIIKSYKQFFNTMKYICNNSYKHFKIIPQKWLFSSYNFYMNNIEDGITVDVSEVLEINNRDKFLKMIQNFLM